MSGSPDRLVIMRKIHRAQARDLCGILRHRTNIHMGQGSNRNILRDEKTTRRKTMGLQLGEGHHAAKVHSGSTEGKPGLRMPTPCEIEDLGHSTQCFAGGQIVDLPADQ